MSISQEIYMEMAPRSPAPGFLRLLALGSKLLHLPGLQRLRPAARQALAVAEPAGRLSIRPHPAQGMEKGGTGITILSANLWHDWPRHRRLKARLEDFARLVETQRADVVLLQEVTRTPGLRVDEWLSERLGMAYIYSRANGHESGIGFEEGLGVFSRFPLSQPKLQQLGDGTNPFIRRLALGAAVLTPCGWLLTFSVHLGLARRKNAIQLAHLRSWVAEVARGLPTLVGGDFNAHEATPQIVAARSTWLDTFRHLHPQADGTTHELCWPWGGSLRRARLDYIFLHEKGPARWQVVEAHHLDAPGRPHSDHRAVLARLTPVSP